MCKFAAGLRGESLSSVRVVGGWGVSGVGGGEIETRTERQRERERETDKDRETEADR